jgi:hypothetical protein
MADALRRQRDLFESPPAPMSISAIAPRDVEIDEAVVAGCEVTQPLRFGQGDYLK